MEKTALNHTHVELLRNPEQLWIPLQNTTGQLKQHKINAGRPTKIKDMNAFKQFVESIPFSQVKDLVPLFEQKFGEDQILYIDESGINTTDTAQYGWSGLGSRCPAVKLGGHGKRLSIISAVRFNSADQFLCPLVFQGSCDRAMFTGWLSYLLKNLAKNNQDQSKRNLLILDNASIHKNGDIEKLVKDFNCRIMYLPAYSQDLNPIEKAWSVLKSKVKNIAVRLDKTIEEAFD